MKALMVWGGMEGHEPKQCVDIFAPWLREQGFEVTVSDSLDAYQDEELMKTVDLIVPVWTGGKITGEQVKSLCETVERGAGIAGWHGGMGDAFRESTAFQYMVGGQWVKHPGGVLEYEVNIADGSDPIMQDITDFTLTSERYYLHVDPTNQVLATIAFNEEVDPWIKGCVMPAVWKRTFGEGRVFHSSLGHVAKDFDVPEVRKITQRGLLWAARKS